MRFTHLVKLLTLAGVLVCAAGCIKSHDVRSFYVDADGRVDMILFFDNVQSDAKGADKVKEEKQWLKDFKGGKLDEFKRFKTLKVKKVKKEVLRDKVPFSALIRAPFETIDQFGRFFDLNTPDSGNTLKWTINEKQRELVFHIGADKKESKDKKAEARAAATTPEDLTPMWKFIPVGGRISEAKGFKISADKTTAWLDFDYVEKEDAKGAGVDLVLRWEVAL